MHNFLDDPMLYKAAVRLDATPAKLEKQPPILPFNTTEEPWRFHVFVMLDTG